MVLKIRNIKNENFKFLLDDVRNYNFRENSIYLCYIENDIIKGVLKYEFNWESIFIKDKCKFCVLFYLETNELYKNQKIASLLANEIFKICKKENQPFLTSYYEKEGELYLRKIFQRFAIQYNVPFMDRNGYEYIWFNKS